MGLQQGVQIGVQQVGAGDDGVRIAALVREGLQPVGL